MSVLREATEAEIAAILRESHSLWGAGLDAASYRALWMELLATSWGREHFRFLVWVGPEGALLSSMKLYRPIVRLDGREERASIFGAVFTPRSRRRRGHAAAMIRAAMSDASARGERLTALFSDIGTAYYERLGFRALPAEEARGTLASSESPQGYRFRPMSVDDIEPVRQAHDDSIRSRSFGMIRDAGHWRFLVERTAGFFSRLDGSDLASRFRVAERDGRFAGYLVAMATRREWSLREAGAPGNDPAVISAILRLGAAEATAAGLRGVRGWMPRDYAELVPEWRLRFEPRRRAVPMIARLDGPTDVSELPSADAAFVPYLDQF